MADVVNGTRNNAPLSALNPDRREKIGQFLSKVRKFAVDSAVADSLLQVKTAVTGRRTAHKIVEEEVKHKPCCSPFLDYKKGEGNLKLANEVGDMNVVKAQVKTTSESAERSEPLYKKPNEGYMGLDKVLENGKKVFIRSRL